MNFTPRIETLATKKLAGKKLNMSFAGNKTYELWRSFMPERNKIKNIVGTGLYSLEIYEPGFFDSFDPGKEFQKWAAVEVTDFENLPDEMRPLLLPSGLYAVFIHRGPASEAERTYGYIHRTWLPQSSFLLDDRPHFALMGEKYKKDDPHSEEEIWIPVQQK